jgi:hypothetical protein
MVWKRFCIGVAAWTSLALVTLTTGCASPLFAASNEPPIPPIIKTSTGQTIPVVAAGYQRSNGSSVVIADSPGPQVLLKGKEPVVVTPGETFHVSFEKKPTSIQENTWKGKDVISLNSHPPPWVFPTTPGEYDYELTAWWGKDYASYDFFVDVRGS